MASIKQQPNGKWRYRIRYKENGKFREVSKSGFRTKRDAQAAANELERKLNSGLVVQHNKDILVQEYLNSWIKLKEKQVKKSTLAKLNRAIRLHILPQFAYYKITEIRRIDCINWVNEMCTHLSIESAKSYCSTFNSALEDAVNDFKLIDSNPMKNIKYPKTEKRKTAIQFFEKRELQTLLVTAESYKV